MNRYNITNHFKENKGKITGFLILTMLAALLLITAINLLSFPHSASGSGNSNNKTGQKQDESKESSGKGKSGDRNTGKKPAFSGDKFAGAYNTPLPDFNSGSNRENTRERSDSDKFSGDNRTIDGKKIPRNGEGGSDVIPGNGKGGRDTIPGNGEGSRDTIPGGILNELEDKFPEFDIDLSNGKDATDFPSFGRGKSFSVHSSESATHTPLFEILGKVKNPLLKMMVQENYNNSKWYAPKVNNYSLYKYKREPGLASIKIKSVNPSKGFIPMPYGIKGAEFPVPGVLEFPDQGIFYTDFELQDYYEAFYNTAVPDEGLLRKDGVCGAAGYHTENINELGRLAESIVYGIENPYAKIEAIEQYLLDNYTLDKPESQDNNNADAVMTFLFNTKKGTQLDFASAFVLLLRCAGMQARMATGYKADPGLDYQIVYSDQLCVFPEVRFETYGWIALDKFTGSLSYNPPVDTRTDITGLDAVAKKGEGFTVKGTVCDNTGKPVDGLPVLIYLKETKEEECLSYFKGDVSNGRFEITCPLNNNVDVGNYQVVARTLASNKYKESWSDPGLKVVTATSVDVSAPESVLIGHDFKISGRLCEIPSKKAVVKDVNVFFNNGIKALEVSPGKNTDGRINKVFRLGISEESRKTRDYLLFCKYSGTYTVEFKGSDFYLPGSSEGKVDILVIFWVRIVLLLILVLIGTAAAVIFTRRKRKCALAASCGTYPLNEVSGDDFPAAEMPGENTIKISFPQIIKPLPNVWCTGEVLTVRFADQYLNYEDMGLTFDKKGEIRISVSLHERRSSVVSESIRIVCYREEVIDIGKALFKELYSCFGLKEEKMTPREIAGAVSGKLDQALCDTLYRIVSIFEKAAYSLEDMRRSQYESFYLLVLDMNESMKDESMKDESMKEGSI